MKPVEFEHLLPYVAKPSRYIDNEINAVHKDPSQHDVKVCLAFPDVYEVGISHLGLKILYSIINQLDYAMADRTYLPWVDLIDLLRGQGLPLFALESRMPLPAFDLIGITLQSELTFSNVLELIDLAGIPVRSCDRSENDPLIIAGGPCASNPLPMSPFIDAFLIGEGEEAIVEVCSILHLTRARSQRLKQIAALQGMYVPTIHDPGSQSIQIRKYNRFHEMSDIHAPQLLSWQLATHNRHVSEIMRGCSRGCRFCHAGYFYRPVRERSMEAIIANIVGELRQSGWDEAGLLSLSSSDYSCIKPLLEYLLEHVNSDKTHVALPSLRVDSLDEDLVNLLGKMGREGLTIAPEAGIQRLRDIINKNLTEEDILKGIETALQLGWQKVKLYFMVGLPYETDADIDALIELIGRINQISRKRLNLNITLSPFVPKPFTPFQWSPMLPRELLLQRILKVKNHFLRCRNIRIRYHTIESSILEALISRGDGFTAEWIYAAWRNGTRYDGWQECFDFQRWEDAAKNNGLEIDKALAGRDIDKRLPWDFIDIGISTGFLRSEYRKAEHAVTTPDCRDVCCMCGICKEQTQTLRAPAPIQQIAEVTRNERIRGTKTHSQQHYRFRVYYEKGGLLRFISHLDWMRMIFRLIAAADLQVVYTQGFSPHPKVSLCPPLANGVLGTNEYFDLELHSPATQEAILHAFNRYGIDGFTVFSCQRILDKMPVAIAEEITLSLLPGLIDQVTCNIAHFQAAESVPYIRQRARGDKTYDLKEVVSSFSIKDDQLTLTKSLHSPGLYDLLQAILDIPKGDLYRLPVMRLRLLSRSV